MTTHLVELERVEKVVELAVLGRLVEAHKVLLQAVQRELLLVVHVDLERLQVVGAIVSLAARSTTEGEGERDARSA